MTSLPKTFKSCVYDKPGQVSIALKDQEMPEPGPGQVLINLTHSGVCHSDYAVMTNGWPALPHPTSPGQVGGHEGVGTIVKLGPGAEVNCKVGDRVGIKWVSAACGSCLACLEGRDGVCFNGQISGYYTPGTFQQYALGPANYVTPIPASLESAAAAPMLCGGVTVFSALRKCGALAGQSVAIIGAGGGLGHLAVQIASRGMGFRVVGIDHSSKEQLAKDSGAEVFVGFDKVEDPVKAVQEATGGLGVSAAIVVTANLRAYEQGLNMLRFGGRLVCVGIPEGEMKAIPNAFPQIMIFKEISILGVAVGNRRDAIECLDMAARGIVKMHYRVEKMDKLADIFQEMEGGKLQGRVSHLCEHGLALLMAQGAGRCRMTVCHDFGVCQQRAALDRVGSDRCRDLHEHSSASPGGNKVKSIHQSDDAGIALTKSGGGQPSVTIYCPPSLAQADGQSAARSRPTSRARYADASDDDPELGLSRKTSRTVHARIYGAGDATTVSGDGRGIAVDGPSWDYDIESLPAPPSNFPLTKGQLDAQADAERADRRASLAAIVLNTPQMRSQRLIGNSNPRYRWEKYYQPAEVLKKMSKPLRKYYERNNYLIQQYLYIDRLLDSSLPHDLIQEYATPVSVPQTIPEEHSLSTSPNTSPSDSQLDFNNMHGNANGNGGAVKVKRTPRDIYHVDENTPLISHDGQDEMGPPDALPIFQPDEDTDSSARIVTIAIWINLIANIVLLVLKVIVTVLSSSLSVLASLVDAALDFLSTFIVFATTWLIAHGDRDILAFPVGRARLEPIGVLVFSVIMITSFFQVALEACQRLAGKDHTVVQLTIPAIAIMATTVLIKGACWAWCRLIRNSSVQALAQDAITDVVFNTFSIIFPLVGFATRTWWLDPLGGLLLSAYVIINWAMTSKTHILNLTGQGASKDERNILLYLTMRFAHTIKSIQGLSAYHAGDKLNVEVDIVLDEEMSLRDSHDLGESLQYVLESVPGVERAFVHADYLSVNIPTHMKQ
ncbi:hypothetical protein FH972_023460 [Carpinus fangiana]|uniref:Enoyl reductase (ER) domain-containing protein n=1 Tax=Carpinus fangiana TaxID=176857 RepID=A0A5N6KVU9_9ROSI|nr:hypothetical protein FH972_023460 [Carpinus fangiana]